MFTVVLKVYVHGLINNSCCHIIDLRMFSAAASHYRADPHHPGELRLEREVPRLLCVRERELRAR